MAPSSSPVRTRGSHPRNTGSNPVGAARHNSAPGFAEDRYRIVSVEGEDRKELGRRRVQYCTRPVFFKVLL